MSTETNMIPSRAAASIALIFAVRDLIQRPPVNKPLDELSSLSMVAMITAVEELQSYLGIFDTLGISMLRTQLRTPYPVGPDPFTCSELTTVICGDFGFQVIRDIVEALPNSRTLDDIQASIDKVCAQAIKEWEHKRNNPAYYEVSYSYPPLGNVELVNVHMPRPVTSLLPGGPERKRLVELISQQFDYLHNCLVVKEKIRAQQRNEEYASVLQKITGVLSASD